MTGSLGEAETRRIRSAVWRWVPTVDRPLPWRGERDPYRILVSEVMLQQTQAGRVVEAYGAFLARFPDLSTLAETHPSDVLQAWGGLGYNRRAMNLWRAAGRIVDGGAFPTTVAGLHALPGVGPYTARAVASFAFGAHEAVVEANVRRIITRFFALPPDADVQHIADRLLPRGRAALWNQALMDLGALVCVPRTPRCGSCPLETACAWRRGDRHRPPASRPRVRFEDTTRYARGRSVASLRTAPDGLTAASLVRRTGLTHERIEGALRALERDGLVSRAGRRWVLGPAQHAASRNRLTSRTT